MSNDHDDRVPYDERDFGIMANNIFHELCELDRNDRENGRPPAWHDIGKFAEKLKAYDNDVDVAYITETILDEERRFIERNRQNNDVRLTDLGRQNCDRGIDIPPSNYQIRSPL